jgi:hypothetical protein
MLRAFKTLAGVIVLKEPLSSPAPHFEGHHLSGQYRAPKAGAAASDNATAATTQKIKDFLISSSSLIVAVIRTRYGQIMHI